MSSSRTLIGIAGAGIVAAGALTGLGSAEAAIGFCAEGSIGYQISSPAGYLETGGHTVVIGLTAPARTVTFTIGEECTLEAGDQWSVSSDYFEAAGTYDGTTASLSDSLTVSVPDSDTEVGAHQVVVTLADVSGSDNDITETNTVLLKRRTEWRDFNVYYESPTPRCGAVSGTPLHGTGRIVRASWTGNAYLSYPGRQVRLVFSPGHAGGDDIADVTIDTTVTNSSGVAHFDFRPPGDRTYFAHYGGNSVAAHDDSSGDHVNCA